MRGMVKEILDHAAHGAIYGLLTALVLDAVEEARTLPLDIKHLEGETASTTIKVAGGSFEVEYHPHAATRQWQTNFGRIQRDQQEAVQDNDTEWETELAEELSEELQKLIVSWDLEYDNTPVPVNAMGMDMLSMPMQQALFQGILSSASGGSEEEKKPRKGRSRKGSR